MVRLLYSTGIEESRWTGGANSGPTIRFREKTSISCVCKSMGLCRISFSKLNSQRQRNLGLWKKVVHPPSTTFPPLRFVNNFRVLYIDFWPKYFQLPTISLKYFHIQLMMIIPYHTMIQSAVNHHLKIFQRNLVKSLHSKAGDF